MMLAKPVLSILILAVVVLLTPGCNDSAVEEGDPDICLQEAQFIWFAECETMDDCCLGDDPLCQLATENDSAKVCTRECTTTPEEDPAEGKCCVASQDHGCDTGCCKVNYVNPDDGTSTAGWGMGYCVPFAE